MIGPNQLREGAGAGVVGELNVREGLDGVVGDIGAGRAGDEEVRDPRLPPLPARANASPACSVSIVPSVSAASTTTPRLMRTSPPPFYPRARSSFFKILPVGFFGSAGTNWMRPGTL